MSEKIWIYFVIDFLLFRKNINYCFSNLIDLINISEIDYNSENN